MGFAYLRRLASLCLRHCSTCVAQMHKGHNYLTSSLPSFGLSPAVSLECPSDCWLLRTGVALVAGLNPTSHDTSDDNHYHLSRMPRREGTVKFRLSGCQDLVRFFALLRIKPHAPPLVWVPVNSFEFHSCECTPQVEYLLRLLRMMALPPDTSIHRLRRGLPGVSNPLFAPHAFESTSVTVQ